MVSLSDSAALDLSRVQNVNETHKKKNQPKTLSLISIKKMTKNTHNN